MAEITEKEIESGESQALVFIEKRPQNIFDESAVFADTTVASFGRRELSAVHLVDIIAHLHRLSRKMPCGHPRGCLVQDAEGTPHCAWCEEVARLRESLAKQIHKRQSAVASVLQERSETEDQILKWNEECGEEIKRLREELALAATREATLAEAANALVQRLAKVNLRASGATALGNALDYGREVTALQDVLELEVSSD